MARPVDAPASRRSGLLLVAALVVLMWSVEIADLVAGDLDSHGIRPRDLDGLPGIVMAPFLHAGFGHLIANTVPFLTLGAALALGGLRRVVAVSACVAVVGGLGTWLTGPEESVHIGASGLVFGYATYLIARGVFSRRLLDLAVGGVVLLVYGTTLLIGVVPVPGVSWQGHLFGGIGGLLAARIARRARRPSAFTGERELSSPR
jgi:membrane associated rhomboid family serine protease